MERRQHDRFKILEDVIIIIDKKQFPAVAYNISKAGVHCVLSAVIHEGKKCQIIIAHCELSGHIKWTENDDDTSIVKCGVEFAEPFPEEEIDTLRRNLLTKK